MDANANGFDLSLLDDPSSNNRPRATASQLTGLSNSQGPLPPHRIQRLDIPFQPGPTSTEFFTNSAFGFGYDSSTYTPQNTNNSSAYRFPSSDQLRLTNDQSTVASSHLDMLYPNNLSCHSDPAGSIQLESRYPTTNTLEFSAPRISQSASFGTTPITPLLASRSRNGAQNSLDDTEIISTANRRELKEDLLPKAMNIIRVWLSEYRHFPEPDEIELLSQLTKTSIFDVKKLFLDLIERGYNDSAYQTMKPEDLSGHPLNPTAPAAPPRKRTHRHVSEASSVSHDPCEVAATPGEQFIHKIPPCDRVKDEAVLRKDESRMYHCPRKCGKSFDKKGTFKKHEEKNIPLRVWVCMVGTTSDDGTCQLCHATKSSVDHLIERHPDHFREHSHSNHFCQQQFYRKDNYVQHLTGKHKVQDVDLEMYSQISCKDMPTSLKTSEQWCGFCEREFANFDWDQRFKHICHHYEEEGKKLDQWTDFEDRIHRRPSKAPRRGDHHGIRHRNDQDDEDGDDSPDGGSGGARGGFSSRKELDSGTSGRGTSYCPQATPGPSGYNTHSGTAYTGSPTDTSHCETRNGGVSRESARPVTSSRADLLAANSTNQHQYTSFVKVKKLGEGAFSVVDEVIHIATRYRLARKTIKLSLRTNKRPSTLAAYAKHLATEIEILQRLRHSHIVRFQGSYSVGKQFFMLLSPAADLNLAQYMLRQETESNPCTTAAVPSQWFGCLASALDYLHGRAITHGDIKPANILVKGSHILLTDFGSSKFFRHYIRDKSSSGPITRQYAAPEVLDHGVNERPSDIWSLGCVFLEIYTYLISGARDKFKRFRNEQFGSDQSYCRNYGSIRYWLKSLNKSRQGQELVLNETTASMLRLDPDKRPTSRQILLKFPPSWCCAPSPLSHSNHNGPFQELYALSSIILDPANIASLDYNSGSKVPRETQEAVSRRYRIADTFLQLWSRRYSNGIGNWLSLATHWFNSCMDGHTICNCSREIPLLQLSPTRLIDVMPDGNSQIRLVEGKQSRGEYVVLSHVWGSSRQPVMLTKGSLKAMKRSIAISDLSATIKDAIAVTKSLGIQYLWMDTLCIIQDDSEDVAKECPRVAEVLSNARLIIAAVPNSTLHSKQAKEEATNDIRQLDHLQEDWPYRAWVFQEILLARRSLLFTESQVFFQCLELEASEALPNGLPGHLWSAVHELTTGKEERQGRRKWQAKENRKWYDIVGASQRPDSGTGNKIKVLSGISRFLEPTLADCCFAGLWNHTLPWSLLWITEGAVVNQEPIEWSGNRYAPSWSWGSISGGIVFPELGIGYDLVEVLSVDEVSRKYCEGEKALPTWCLRLYGQVGNVKVNERARNSDTKQLVEVAGWEEQFQASIYFDTTDYAEEEAYDCLWLRADIGGGTTETAPTLLGLLLKAEDIGRKTYTRHGLICLSAKRERTEALRALINDGKDRQLARHIEPLVLF